MLGSSTSAAQIPHVPAHALWLLLGDQELMLPFETFPWFRQATIGRLSQVESPTPNHAYRPLLDVDLSVESIRNPAAFPLVAQAEG